VPLRRNYDDSSFEIDFDGIMRICKGSKEDLNGGQWRSSIKEQLVQVRGGKGKRHLYISYGIQKRPYSFRSTAVRDGDEKQREDDAQSVRTFKTFASSRVADGFEALHIGMKGKASMDGKRVILMRQADTKIQNVLNVYRKSQSGHQLQRSLVKKTVDEVYPTGITSKMWYSLRNLPSTLWMVERWLLILTLKDKLSERVDIELDSTLLFQALHRDHTSTNNSYQILNTLGAYTIKFATTLHKFYENPMAPSSTIMEFVANRMEKNDDSEHIPLHKVLLTAAAQCDVDIASFAILDAFDCKSWSPSRCVVAPQRQPDRRTSALLMQSVIGVCFYSAMMSKATDLDGTRTIPHAIRSVHRFLHFLKVIPRPFEIAPGFARIESGADVAAMVDPLRQIAFTEKLEPNSSLNAALYSVCREGPRHRHSDCVYAPHGFTFDRLACFGDALLDLIVVWNITRSIGYDQVFVPRIGGKARTGNWGMYMTEERHSFAADEHLAASMIKNSLTQHLSWLSADQKEAVTRLSRAVAIKYGHRGRRYRGKRTDCGGKEDVDDSKSDVSGQTEASLLIDVNKERISPMGDKKHSRFADHKVAVKLLGSTFEALLGAAFVGSNHELYGQRSLQLFNVVPSIEFLICFLGNHSAMEKMMRSYTDKYFDVIISKTPFSESGQDIDGLRRIEEYPHEFLGMSTLKQLYDVGAMECVHCGHRGLVFNASYDRSYERSGSWKDMVCSLSGDDGELMELLMQMNAAHDVIDKVQEYRCNACGYHIGYVFKLDRTYDTKLKPPFLTSKQMTVSRVDIDKVAVGQEQIGGKLEHAQERCEKCSGKMNQIYHERSPQREGLEGKEEMYFCDLCHLYMQRTVLWTRNFKQRISAV